LHLDNVLLGESSLDILLTLFTIPAKLFLTTKAVANVDGKVAEAIIK